MNHKDILDDSHFIDNLIIGRPIWSGQPSLYHAIPIKDLSQEISLFIVFTFFVIVSYATTDFLIGQPNLIRFWVLLLSVVYVLCYFFQAKKWYEFFKEMKSTYIITETHIALLEQSGKLTYSYPLNQLYQVVIKKERKEFGNLCMMIKRDSPSKKKKITVSQNMPYPDCSFKGLENVREIAELLVQIRNDNHQIIDI